MSDNQVLGEIRGLVGEIQGLEQELQALTEATSFGVLTDQTRAALDRLLLASLIAFALGTVAKLEKPELGPFSMEIAANWAVPSALVVIVLFYSASLGLLAHADFTKWNATYSLKSAVIASTLRKLFDEQKRVAFEAEERIRRKLTEDLVGKTVEEVQAEMVEETRPFTEARDALGKLIRATGRPAAKMRHQCRLQMTLFVVAPICFAGASAIFVLVSLVRHL